MKSIIHYKFNEYDPARWHFNSLARGRCGCNMKLVISKFISKIDIFSIFCEITLGGMPQDLAELSDVRQQAITWTNAD